MDRNRSQRRLFQYFMAARVSVQCRRQIRIFLCELDLHLVDTTAACFQVELSVPKVILDSFIQANVVLEAAQVTERDRICYASKVIK
mmetsp:Transcript_49768/g.117032  ORF Transcript_49768/g.117032 Transcript_49768/m.117032 type:complete len:87 (-) Transcript_49768:542-802(-)